MTQAQTAASGKWAVPRLADGKPDLQGIWDWKTITPLERPKEFAGQKVLTTQQAAARQRRAEDSELIDRPNSGGTGAYNQAFRDRGTSAADLRTSLIDDPPDGKLPPLVPGAARQPGSASEDIPAEPPIRYRNGGAGTDGPEPRGLAVGC